MSEREEWLRARVREEVKKWFNAQCDNPHKKYYLMFTNGDIAISDQLPENWEYASTEAIGGYHTPEQVRTWAINILKNTPVYQ